MLAALLVGHDIREILKLFSQSPTNDRQNLFEDKTNRNKTPYFLRSRCTTRALLSSRCQLKETDFVQKITKKGLDQITT